MHNDLDAAELQQHVCGFVGSTAYCCLHVCADFGNSALCTWPLNQFAENFKAGKRVM